MKRKFFTTLALFVSLALTACGGGKGNGGDAKWESDKTNHWHIVDGKETDKTKHQFEEDKSKSVAATCKAEGKKVEVCKVCGYEKITPIKKADHTYETWTPVGEGSYCGPEKEEATCKICQHKETRDCPIVQHKWEKKSDVAAADGGVAYQIVECSECKKQAYMVPAAQATLSDGASKKTAPEGCVKMSPDSSYMTLAFKVDAAKTGTWFLRGAMDYWYESGNTTNEEKTYYSANNGHTDAATKTGNFKLEVGPDADHLTNVELPDNTALKFNDMLPETVNSHEGDHNWSIIGDCIVNKGSLAAGLNTIKFTRVDSYNLAIHDFVFVISNAA